MSIFSFSAICTAFLTGCGGIRLKRVLFSIIIVATILSFAVFGLRLGFASMLGDSSQGSQIILNLKMPLDANGKIVDHRVYKNISEVSSIGAITDALEDGGLMANIKSRDVLRVGYNSDAMPFSFFNKNGDLVGYDIHMAYDLAKILNISPH